MKVIIGKIPLICQPCYNQQLIMCHRERTVQHLECPSFLLHLHFWKCALLLHIFCTESPFQHKDVEFKCPDWQEVEKKHFKMKCNIGMNRGTRSKMTCKIRAHFPPIWVYMYGCTSCSTSHLIRLHFPQTWRHLVEPQQCMERKFCSPRVVCRRLLPLYTCGRSISH